MVTKIVCIQNCWDCPHADHDRDETCVPDHPFCRHPFTKIYTREYVAHYIPFEGIREDCPLETVEE
jgi:hypothetical protein